MKKIEKNTYSLTKTVEERMLASVIGSGDVDVYATPMMIAAMEECAKKCLEPYLEDGEASVGIMIHTTHISPTPLHKQVYIHAKIQEIDNKKITFLIEAKDDAGLIGEATHQRCIIKKASFEERIKQKYR